MKESKLKTFYAVEDGWGGQRGSFIEEVQMTEKEFREEKQNRKGRALFRKYIEALYYTQD